MKLDGFRLYRYNKGQETLIQYISDRETIINYYKNYPDELKKMRVKQDWRPTSWYPSAKSIDELLSLFEDEVDSLKENYKQVLTDWEDRGYVSWDSIMKYKFKIIQVSGNEAIGKIIWKKAPYVTPQKGDMIEFEE